MSSEHYCPRCQSKNVILYDDHIECIDCKLSFFLEDIESNMDDENILSLEEKHGILDAFDEEERKKLKRMFEEEDFD